MEFVVIHLWTLLITIIAIVYSDHLAFQYFKGKRLVIDRALTNRLHVIVWCGLIGMIGSGITLFLPLSSYLLTEPSFYLKMAFVLTLIFNALIIGKISHVASERPFSALSPHEKRLLITSGIISSISWVSAALIGFFFL
jgi:hypothetical protein